MNPRLPTLTLSFAALATSVLLVGCAGTPSSDVAEVSPSRSAVTTVAGTSPSGPGDGTSTPEPTPSTEPAPVPILDAVDLIELTDGAAGDVAPEFSWTPIAGAAGYRLVVLTDGEPSWAWQGETTTVRLGGLPADAGAAFPTPDLDEGSTWSVVALDAAGSVLAASDQRVVRS